MTPMVIFVFTLSELSGADISTTTASAQLLMSSDLGIALDKTTVAESTQLFKSSDLVKKKLRYLSDQLATP